MLHPLKHLYDACESALARLPKPAFCLLLLALLAAANFRHLDNPPHWDDLIGLHNQARFIARHDFKPLALLRESNPDYPGTALGDGSNIYPYAITPWIHALFYRLPTPRLCHVAGHIFNLTCLAVAGTLLFALLCRHLSPLAAAALTGAALCEPVLSGITASLGQEAPAVLAVMLALWLMLGGYRKSALAAAAGGVLLRGSVAIFLAVLILHELMDATFSPAPVGPAERRRQRTVAWLVAMPIAAALTLLARHHLLGGEHSWNYLATTLKGLLVWLLPATTLLWLAALAATARHTFTLPPPLRRCYLQTMLLMLLPYPLLLAAMTMVTRQLPRYAGFAVMPMVLALAYALPTGKGRRLTPLFLALAALLHLWPHPPLPASLGRSGEYLERNRDYLLDLQANRRLCASLEADAFSVPIVATWPYILMLTVPEFGYVRRPLPNVFAAHPVIPRYAPVAPWKPGDALSPQTLFLFSHTSLMPESHRFAPARGDQIVYIDNTCGSPLLLYRQAPGK